MNIQAFCFGFLGRLLAREFVIGYSSIGAKRFL